MKPDREVVSKFRTWFWQPPRPHGQQLEHRTVTNLELFYDLVYVVVIAQAAHHVSTHSTWRSVADFAVIFGLIWIAWLNGTLWYDLHGQPGGRSRLYVFFQMLILALLAVYTANAGRADGPAFAIVYAVFMATLGWLWLDVRRIDEPQYLAATMRYLIGVMLTIGFVLLSALVSDALRVAMWAVVVASWMIGLTAMAKHIFGNRGSGSMVVTESTVERFGLLTIIVLGEVVVGVVNGFSDSTRDLRTYVTAALGLMAGFAIWWTYFDFVGRRLPAQTGASVARWLISHLPIVAGVAAAGAALPGLIEHADDHHVPEVTSWLFAGSIAIVLLAMTVNISSLQDYQRFPTVFRPAMAGMAISAALALVAAWWQPAPWLLALILVVLLSTVWSMSVYFWLGLEHPEDAIP